MLKVLNEATGRQEYRSRAIKFRQRLVASVPLHHVISDFHELEITPGTGLMEHGEYEKPNI